MCDGSLQGQVLGHNLGMQRVSAYLFIFLKTKMVIPMAVSLGFGVLFATVVTLVMIPSLYLIIEDMKNLRRRRKKQPQKEAAGVSNEPQIATKTVS